MAYKLNKIEKSINDLKNIVINGISHLSTKLDDISVKEAVVQLAEHKVKVKKAFANINDRLGL